MNVTIETQETKTYKFSYSFLDNLGVKTTVEGFDSIEDIKKHIKKTMRKMKKENFTIIEQ